MHFTWMVLIFLTVAVASAPSRDPSASSDPGRRVFNRWKPV